MKKIQAVPTIKKGVSCVVRTPLVLVPYLVYFVIAVLFMVYGISKIEALLPAFAGPEESPFNIMGIFFSLLAFAFLAILVIGLLSPFIEGWTFAALASAHKNEPVSLKEAARKAGSKYLGMLALAILIVIISSVVGSIVSTPLTIMRYMRMFEVASTSVPPSTMFISQIRWSVVTYGVVTMVTALVMVLFVYMKPAYIIGDIDLSKSLNDGLDTARNNYLASLVIFLVFTVIEAGVFLAPFAVMLSKGVSFLDMETLMNIQDITEVYPYIQILVILGAVLILMTLLVRVILSAAISYAYMDSHEMLS
ncbi:MAG: hypothetical protein PVF58_11175 [Candidatus Methanofastidiosia archaeon]|jgi:hypothetical protein